MSDDIVDRLRDWAEWLAEEEAAFGLAEAAGEIEALRAVVFEACDVALVKYSGEPACFGGYDSYEDWIESARFTTEQVAAVKRALEGRVG